MDTTVHQSLRGVSMHSQPRAQADSLQARPHALRRNQLRRRNIVRLIHHSDANPLNPQPSGSHVGRKVLGSILVEDAPQLGHESLEDGLDLRLRRLRVGWTYGDLTPNDEHSVRRQWWPEGEAPLAGKERQSDTQLAQHPQLQCTREPEHLEELVLSEAVGGNEAAQM